MFPVCFPGLQSLLKMVSSHKRTNFQKSKLFSFSIVSHLEGKQKRKKMVEFLPLNVYPYLTYQTQFVSRWPDIILFQHCVPTVML